MEAGLLNSAGSRLAQHKLTSTSQPATCRVHSAHRDLHIPQWTRGGTITSIDTRPPVVCQQGPPPPSPIVMERFQQVISQLFNQRIIRLGGPVDDDMANLLVAQMLYLDSKGKQDITMYVNSPGGSVTAGMAVFDTMRHIRPDVSTTCVGLAASMAAFLLAAGQKNKRYSLPNSRIMIHQPLGGAQGQAADIEIQANEILHHKTTLNGYLAEFTGQPEDKIYIDTDRDFFLSAQESVEYGLIDAVISKPNIALAAAAINSSNGSNGAVSLSNGA